MREKLLCSPEFGVEEFKKESLKRLSLYNDPDVEAICIWVKKTCLEWKTHILLLSLSGHN